jgi:hypothetical protein
MILLAAWRANLRIRVNITLFTFTMTTRCFPPSPDASLKGNHNAGSRVQHATSIGNEPVVPKITMRAPIIDTSTGQGSQDHPGKSLRPPLPVDLLRVAGLPRQPWRHREAFNDRIDANNIREPAFVIKANPILLNDAARLPEDYGVSKRRASSHPGSEHPVTKRAKKQHPTCRRYPSQNAAKDGGCQPAVRETAPPYQDVAQVKVKREPTCTRKVKVETTPETSASGQEIKREPVIKIENDPNTATLRQEIEDMAAAHEAAREEWKAEKKTIEANLAAAKETTEVLEQDQSARHDQMSELVEKVAAVSTELEEAKASIGIANNSISNLEISLGKLTAERDEMKYTIAGIKVVTSEQLKSLSIDKDAAIAHIEELETKLGSATRERDVSRSELVASNTKAIESAATIDSLEESVLQTSLQVESVSEEKEAALADVTELESKLKDACQGHGEESQGLKTNLVALQTQIDALETQLAQTKQERNNIQSDTECSMPGATSDDEFPTAAAAAADDDDDDDDDDLGNNNCDDDAVAPLVEFESSHDSTLPRSSCQKIPTSRTSTPVPQPEEEAVARATARHPHPYYNPGWGYPSSYYGYSQHAPPPPPPHGHGHNPHPWHPGYHVGPYGPPNTQWGGPPPPGKSPVAASRKRPQPTSTKSQKRKKIDVGEDGKPEPGPGKSGWETVARISQKEEFPRPTSAQIHGVLEGQCAGRFYSERGFGSTPKLKSKGNYSFDSASYRCDCANATSSETCAKVRVVCRKDESSRPPTVDFFVQKALKEDKFCFHILNGDSDQEVAGKRIV